MTSEQQRIAIAEACGWKNCVGGSGFVTRYKGTPSETTVRVTLPDYLNDLNAMHEAENNLQGMNKAEFAVQLCRVAGKDWSNGIGGGSFIHIHATAAQRAEAFLKTLNLWTK